MNERRQMVWREEIVRFSKKIRVKSDGNDEEKEETIEQKARIITYAAEKNSGKKKHWEITRLLTNFRLNLLVFNRFRQEIYVYRTLIILYSQFFQPTPHSVRAPRISVFWRLEN